MSYWRQRFYVDESYWLGAGYPIFLYIGGEGPQGPVSPRLFISTLAEEHGALLIALEHRFYGESFPTPDMSVPNLRFLTSEQALADLARFVQYLLRFSPATPDAASDPPLSLSAPTADSKVVAFGGSYPGNLAAWVRLKYPSLFAGTVASSAPVHAEYNFEQYAQVVGEAMGYASIGGSPQCVAAAAAGTAALRKLVTATTPMGTSADIPEALRPCAPIRRREDLSTYEASLFGNLQGAVQYNLEGRPPYVSDVCSALAGGSPPKPPLLGLAAATALFSNSSAPFGKRCVPSSWEKDMMAELRNVTFDGRASSRQWIWQSCNEFGFFQSTSGGGQPFSPFKAVGIELAGKRICEDAFGMKRYKGPNALWTITNYGGRDLQGANIVVVNGNMDPWRALGLVNRTDRFFDSCVGDGPCRPQALSSSEHLVFLDGTAHCRDMYAPKALEAAGIADTTPVVWAHAKISAAVASFLQ